MSTVQLRPSKKQKTARDNAIPRSDNLHIAMIAEDLQPPLDEGAKKAGYNIICSLKQKGAVLSVFTRYKNSLLGDSFLLPENIFLLGYSFSRCLRLQSPDVILYLPSSSGTIGAFIRAAIIKMQSSGVPLALLNLQYRSLPSAARLIGLNRLVDVAFVQSQSSASVLKSFGCKTIMLPGGVNSSIFRPVVGNEKTALRARYGFHESERIILHVGHGNRERNIRTLIRLVEVGYRVIFIASTSTQLDAELLAELRTAGITVITHFIENIQHFYQLSDCYVFPVFHATSAVDAPLSVLEAMACNIPVITTPFGALPAMFRPEKGVFFIKREDDLASLVQQALAIDDCETSAMVVPYSWDAAASTIFGTLRNVLNLKGTGQGKEEITA